MRYLTTFLVLALVTTALGQNSSAPIQESKRAALTRAAEFHAFTKIDGTKIQARPVDFSASSSTVKLEAEDGRKYEIKLSDLSKGDQLYIQGWFTGYSKIRVRISEKTDSDKLFKGNLDDWDSMFPNMKYKDHWSTETKGTTYDAVSYELNVENISTQKLTDIIVEYCIYHQTAIKEEFMVLEYTASYSREPIWAGYPAKNGKKPDQVVSNTIWGTVFFQEIPSEEKSIANTDSVKIVKKSQEKTEYRPAPSHKTGDRGTRNTRTIEGELLGIRCRVYVPTEAGNYAMIEASSPNSLRLNTDWIAP